MITLGFLFIVLGVGFIAGVIFHSWVMLQQEIEHEKKEAGTKRVMMNIKDPMRRQALANLRDEEVQKLKKFYGE